jgi:peptidoglycan/xylan/chitin deacetylase (PgdA/CDA1 family)
MTVIRRLRNTLVVACDWWPSRRAGSRIITLHDVPDRRKLQDRLNWLRRHYSVQSLRDLLTRPPDQAVAITFDDGYASWHDVAMPVLRELGLPATFFLCSGFIGLEGEEASRFAQNRMQRSSRLTPLTRDQVRRLAEVPEFDIGSHTASHADLSKLPPDEISREVADDRRCLEGLTGRTVSMFAYPFGQARHASAEARAAVACAGFESAFTIVPHFVEQADDRFAIGRDSLDVGDSTRLWEAWLRGSYDALYRLRHRS